jgi:anti-anti-sigma factor
VNLTGDHTALIIIRGEACIGTRARLRKSLADVRLEEAVRDVYVDLSGLTFCDAQAIRELAGFVDHARQTGHEASVHNARPVVRRLSTLMRLNEDLHLD